jgi:hypothetical protein
MRRHVISARARHEGGFTTIVVLAALLIGTLLVAAAFTVALGDTGPSRHDQAYKQAYAAADAGVNYYLAHLVQSPTFLQNCGAGNVQTPGTAFSTGTSVAVPNSQERFEIELLPAAHAPNPSGGCNSAANGDAQVIDSATGQITIRATGSAGGVRRSVIATFKRQGFLNYMWYTDKETQDPKTYSNLTTANTYCANRYHRAFGANPARPDGTVSGGYCGDQSFTDGDQLNGPLHTNDELKICSGSPVFGRPGKDDAIEVSDGVSNGGQGWRTCDDRDHSRPTINGTLRAGAPMIDLPSDDSALQTYAYDPSSPSTACDAAAARPPANCWNFTGPVHITFGAHGVKVVGTTTAAGGTGTQYKDGTSYPPNGVIYVQNARSGTACSAPTNYGDTLTYPRNDHCGDAWVQGNASGDVTVGADNDVIVEGNVTHNPGVAVGLVANNFVRLYHPGSGNGASGSEKPGGTNLVSPEIDAAILAVNHSFQVDNWDEGPGPGTLGSITVKGVIAQKYRGTVGLVGGSGYLKNYNYDPTLKYHEPPHFLAPQSAVWQIWSQTEQVPAH